MNNQQKRYNFIMYFYLYVHQHLSAKNENIFRVMKQEYNCS